jgi:hypothetical protein
MIAKTLSQARPSAPPTSAPAHMSAEARSIVQAVREYLENPTDDCIALKRRIACLQFWADDLTTDDLSRWVKSVRRLLDTAR